MVGLLVVVVVEEVDRVIMTARHDLGSLRQR
jgi:hypothetical protein